jgi:hypothetical protein
MQHALESQSAAADDIAATGAVDPGHEQDGHHHHGAPDVNDQCCTMHHHLAAVLPLAGGADRGRAIAASLVLPPEVVLRTRDPSLLERPPKLLLSV